MDRDVCLSSSKARAGLGAARLIAYPSMTPLGMRPSFFHPIYKKSGAS